MAALVRINKLLSQAGAASRRKADELIAKGAVSVNGKVLNAPGVIVDTTKDKIYVNGKAITLQEARRHYYFLLNKPKGYISTVTDTHNRKTIMDLVPKVPGLFPVGRLDKDTTGLILITNDGSLAHRLMHPRYEVEKIYDVEVSGRLSDGDISKIRRGVDIGDERLACAEILKIKRSKDTTKLSIRIHEGRNRQVRRTFDALGYQVISLNRTSYAGLKLDIKEGHYQEVSRNVFGARVSLPAGRQVCLKDVPKERYT
jgi:23S rRNA pseudouridine2605 synthase